MHKLININKHLLSKTLQNQQKNGLSQQRIRNFFEVNPIYPDYQDQDSILYRNPEIQPSGQNQNKLEQIKKKHMKYMYGKARQYVKKQQLKERSKKAGKQDQLDNQSNLYDRVSAIAQSILVDQESQLMFGFGFDQFIQDLKEKRTKDAEGEYLQKLQQILFKLKIKNDTELVQLYKYVIAKDTRDSYRNEARKIIIKRVLQEARQMGQQSQQDLEKYIDFSKTNKSEMISQLQNENGGEIENQQLQKDLENSLQQSQIDTVASNLALNKLQAKIDENRSQESWASKQPKRIFDSDFEDELDLFGVNTDQNNKRKQLGLNNTSSFYDNVESWKADSIYQEIKQNFQRNRDQYLDEQEEIEKQENNYDEFFSFLEKSEADKEIEKYLVRFNLADELMEKPDFGDILQNIDYLIDKAPISLKSKLNNDSNEFKGVFVSQDLSDTDLVWSNFSKNFQKIFPSGSKLQDQQNQNSGNVNLDDKLCASNDIPTIYEYEGSIEKEENIRSHVFNEKDLKEEERVELEVYRRIQKDPFFSHYIQNDLRYFSERMLDGYNNTQKLMTLYDKTGDIMNYNEANFDEKQLQILDMDEPEVQYKRQKQIENEIKERVFAGGKRKTSHCRVMLTRGSGQVTVNRKPYLDYFPHPVLRNICLKPIYLASVPCQFDVDIQVRGGGEFGQAQAISVGLTRAIVKQLPHLRKMFIKHNMIQTDPRKKERKKTGQYKARKAWTYVRR